MLTDSDKLWIQKNLNGVNLKFYQMTYMTGPINVTVGLKDKKEVVQAVADLVEEARKNEVLNAVQKIKTPEEMKPELQAKCKECGEPMVKKEGTTKGKKWAGLFCPDRQHDPIWL